MNRNAYFAGWGIALLLGLSLLLNFYFLFQQGLMQMELKEVSTQIARIQAKQGPLTPPLVEKEIQNLVLDLAIYGQKQPAVFNILKKYGVGPPAKPLSANKSTQTTKP